MKRIPNSFLAVQKTNPAYWSILLYFGRENRLRGFRVIDSPHKKRLMKGRFEAVMPSGNPVGFPARNIMTDSTLNRIRKFSEDRDWDQFHTPANLAKSIAIEAAELLECFQWSDTDFDLEHVKEELADVMVYCVDLLDRLHLDADEIINAKMTKNEQKYPVEKARGNSAKYTELY